MAERKGGLGRGLAALIPSAPSDIDKNGKTPGIGGGASDVIFGKQAPKPDDAPKGAPKKVQGAPTVSAKRDKVIQPVPVGARYQEIPVGQIIPNPKQPRQVFDEDELAELVHSIREFGLLQPIVVRDTPEGFELIMGERRWRAAAKAGLATIPAIVRDTADDTMLRDALLENIHRVQLNPLEEANAYQQLLEEFGVTQNELADRLGRSRPQVTNTLRLLRLPVSVQRRVAAGVLSNGHARALLSLDGDEEAMDHIAQRVIAEGLSVRATEEAVTLYKREGKKDAAPQRQKAPQPQYFTDTAEKLSDRFDTKVTVTMGKKKGKMVVEFGDQDDLERIMGLIGGEEE